MIDVNLDDCTPFLTPSQIEECNQKALDAFDILTSGKGGGAAYLGWKSLPSDSKESDFNDYYKIVERWSAKKVEIVIIIGVGGSYLGAKAAISALSHTFERELNSYRPQIIFAGFNLSEEYIYELLDLMKSKSVATVVISKSGTTLEPAIAFRIIKRHLEERYSKEEAKERIVAITDSSKGALKELADIEGYTTFAIQDSVGGRFSVLSSVGLLPIALAGFDIKDIIEGAKEMEQICSMRTLDNPAIKYAMARNSLYSIGKKIEVLALYNPKMRFFSEWWKQLFGESEGKGGKGLFPAAVNLSTDLHSIGQYIQDGERLMFETVLSIKHSNRSVIINSESNNLDGLNYLAGRSVEDCNEKAQKGARMAHVNGGVPNVVIEIENINEYNIGAIFYFFEFACSISAYMLGVNPFDQPGVEEYKNNMFALMGKPERKDLK